MRPNVFKASSHPDQISENIEFAAQELLDAPADQRPAMLESIAKR